MYYLCNVIKNKYTLLILIPIVVQVKRFKNYVQIIRLFH